MTQHSNYRWAVLFASFFTFVAFALVFQLVPPLLKDIKADFGTSDAELGLLMSIVVVPGIFLALPAGLLVDKYGFRSLGLLSTILVALGSLTTAFADTFVTALLGRFILGVGGAFVVVGTPTLIPQWFARKDLGKAMGFFGTNMPVATIVAFPAATVLAQSFNWHSPFFLGTAVAIAAALFFAVIVKEGPLRGERKPVGFAEVKRAVKTAEVWKASIVWMLFNTAAIAYLSWAPTLFRDFKGLEPVHASILATVLMYAAVVFVPIFGWASDKSGKRKPFMVTGSVLMALALIAAAYAVDITLILAVTLLGVAAAMVPPLVMAIAADSLPPNNAGIGFSIVTLCQNIGITFSAPFGGYLIQSTMFLPLIFFGISLFAFAAAFAALTLTTK